MATDYTDDDSKRVFVASVLLSGILANGTYDPPRSAKTELMCKDAVNFADCLIKNLHKPESDEDISHTSSIMNNAVKSLNDIVSDYALCEQIIKAIAEGKVKHVSIEF